MTDKEPQENTLVQTDDVIGRRDFLRRAAVTLGAAALGTSTVNAQEAATTDDTQNPTPRTDERKRSGVYTKRRRTGAGDATSTLIATGALAGYMVLASRSDRKKDEEESERGR